MPDRKKAAPPADDAEQGIWIDYWTLPWLEEAMREDNPKDHDIGLIDTGINKHGFRGAVMIDERSGKLQAGHGRVTTLAQKKAAGESPPAGVRVDGEGNWLVPVIRGEAWRSDADARGFVTLDNQAAIAGGWVEPLLAEWLQAQVAEVGDLEGTGFDAEDLDDLLARLAGGERDGGGANGGDGDNPDEFPNYDDETIPTEHECPKCGYKWSGGE
jgi:hypothetical protein